MKTRFKKGARVWWNDPDANTASGWGVITAIRPDFVTLRMDSGSHVEAPKHELYLKKPRTRNG